MTATEKAVDEYHQQMLKKYGTVHWDRDCTDEEWEEFGRLCKLKELEEKERDEEEEEE